MATSNARAARERKQKIFVAIGGLVLLALLAFQLPKMLGGSETSTAAGDTETTLTGETTPGETTPTTTPTPGRTSVSLPDTDRPLELGPGQFRSFSVFTRKDPFVQQIVSPDSQNRDGGSDGGSDGGGGGSGDGGGGGGDKATGPEKTPSKGFSVGDSPQAAVTVISVNGARQTLSTGSAFPVTDPVFVLVAEQPGAKTVVIGVAGGAYASGARTTKLKVGKPLVLVNTTTGARYRLVLVAVGTEASTPAAPAAGAPSGAKTP